MADTVAVFGMFAFMVSYMRFCQKQQQQRKDTPVAPTPHKTITNHDKQTQTDLEPPLFADAVLI